VRISYDRDTDSAYVSLRDEEAGGPAERQSFHQPNTMGLIVLDFDERHRLVGLEILEAKKNLPPDVLDRAD
jgi:uncharacterized protein YuzE